jgi:hypothetical protein
LGKILRMTHWCFGMLRITGLWMTEPQRDYLSSWIAILVCFTTFTLLCSRHCQTQSQTPIGKRWNLINTKCFFLFFNYFMYFKKNLRILVNGQAMATWPDALKIAKMAKNSHLWTHWLRAQSQSTRAVCRRQRHSSLDAWLWELRIIFYY